MALPTTPPTTPPRRPRSTPWRPPCWTTPWTAAKQTAPRKKKKKRPVDPERAATKFVKTATNPVTWKNGIYAGSLAIAVLLPVALLALAQK